MFHKIQSVTPLPDFRLLAHFTDGTSKNYDVAPLFDEMPVFSPLRDVPGLFEQVSVDPGGYGISWNDDIDLDASELWENGTPAASPFDGFLSFADATALWALNESSGSLPVPPWNGNMGRFRRAAQSEQRFAAPIRGGFSYFPAARCSNSAFVLANLRVTARPRALGPTWLLMEKARGL